MAEIESTESELIGSATPAFDPGAGADAPPAAARLPLDAIVAYGLPTLVLGFSSSLVSLYILKFATDVLLIAPGIFAASYALARVWDGLSDPIAGYMSDRTTHRSGRRRPWIFVGAIPLAVSTIALWSPPAFLSGTPMIIWISGAIVFFYTAYTVVSVPHLALGAEMTEDHHERTRVFGARGIFDFVGVLLAALSIWYFQTSTDTRIATSLVAWTFVVLSVPLLWGSVSRIREPAEHQSRGSPTIGSAFRDVARNHHARILIAVFFLETMSMATIGALYPYVSQYLMPETDQSTGIYIAMVMAVTLLSFPAWFPIARRFGKRNTWIASNVMKTVSFAALYFAQPGYSLPSYIAIIGIGASLGAHVTLAPSIKADVVDYDEYKTGERKEGSYFAIWNFVLKLAGAVAVGLSGLFLQLSGYQPNVEQSPSAILAIRTLFAGVPAVLHLMAIALLLRFTLDKKQHDQIRAAIDARRRSNHKHDMPDVPNIN